MRYWIMAVAVMAAPVAAQTATPGAEAEALGKRIAERGTLATLLPLMTGKDIEAMIAEHPELDAAGQARLRAAADATMRGASERLIAAIGHQYATRLSLDDLRAIAAFTDSPAAQHRQAAEPAVIGATAGALDGFDFKKEAWTAYCAAPGSACAAAK